MIAAMPLEPGAVHEVTDTVPNLAKFLERTMKKGQA
jgi:hypothetical protein